MSFRDPLPLAGSNLEPIRKRFFLDVAPVDKKAALLEQALFKYTSLKAVIFAEIQRLSKTNSKLASKLETVRLHLINQIYAMEQLNHFQAQLISQLRDYNHAIEQRSRGRDHCAKLFFAELQHVKNAMVREKEMNKRSSHAAELLLSLLKIEPAVPLFSNSVRDLLALREIAKESFTQAEIGAKTLVSQARQLRGLLLKEQPNLIREFLLEKTVLSTKRRKILTDAITILTVLQAHPDALPRHAHQGLGMFQHTVALPRVQSGPQEKVNKNGLRG